MEILPALRSIVDGWVIKKSPSMPPQKITSDDLDALAQASIETLTQRAFGTADGEWGRLEELTRGWIVQRQRGGTPGPMEADDFRQFIRFVFEGMTRERSGGVNDTQGHTRSDTQAAEQPLEEQDLSVYLPESDEVLPDGRRITDVLREDPFYFAREHLAMSL